LTVRQLPFIEPGKFEWHDVPTPRIGTVTDAIVRPLRCGTDQSEADCNDAQRGDSMTTLRSDNQFPSADRGSLGYLPVALNRHDDGGDRVMFKEPDSLADYEWPPVELVLDHYEACLGGAPIDHARAAVAWIGYE
jgi:hypothetical protein